MDLNRFATLAKLHCRHSFEPFAALAGAKKGLKYRVSVPAFVWR
mgnify:FL=1